MQKKRVTASPSCGGLSFSLANTRSSPRLPEAARLALRLKQREDVALAHGALDVAHDQAVLVVQELDADLGDLFCDGFSLMGFVEGREEEEEGGRGQEGRRRRERERGGRFFGRRRRRGGPSPVATPCLVASASLGQEPGQLTPAAGSSGERIGRCRILGGSG